MTNIKSIQLPVKQSKRGQSMLWKISSKELPHSSYIFGTIHMMYEKDFIIKPKVYNALQNSNSLFLEINYSDLSEIKAMQEMTESDIKLSERVSPEKARELDEVLKSYNLCLVQIDNYSIQALYSLVLSKVMDNTLEKKMPDVELMNIAIQYGKNIFGLETVAEQLRVLENAYSLESCIEQLKMGDEYAITFSQMVEFYKNEDLPSLYAILRKRSFLDKKAEQLMLIERNREWVSKIGGLIKEEPVFFAVGSGHLWGNNGLINLLKREGYLVKPIIDTE